MIRKLSISGLALALLALTRSASADPAPAAPAPAVPCADGACMKPCCRATQDVKKVIKPCYTSVCEDYCEVACPGCLFGHCTTCGPNTRCLLKHRKILVTKLKPHDECINKCVLDHVPVYSEPCQAPCAAPGPVVGPHGPGVVIPPGYSTPGPAVIPPGYSTPVPSGSPMPIRTSPY
jgi:hypothetical protein